MTVSLCIRLGVGSLDLEGRLGKAHEDLNVMGKKQALQREAAWSWSGASKLKSVDNETREMGRVQTRHSLVGPGGDFELLFSSVFYVIWVSNQPWEEGVQLPISQTENWGLEYKNKKKNLPAIYNMDGLWRHYAKWNKLDRERQILYDLIKKTKQGTSLAVQRLRLHASAAGGAGSNPGRGAKMPHATQCSQKVKMNNNFKKTKAKQNKSSS